MYIYHILLNIHVMEDVFKTSLKNDVFLLFNREIDVHQQTTGSNQYLVC